MNTLEIIGLIPIFAMIVFGAFAYGVHRKTVLIRALTAVLPREFLRQAYIRYASVMARIRYGDPLFPRIISIEINTHCNRACDYCPNAVVPTKSKLMKAETFQAIVERLREIRYAGVVDFIWFSEPTLHPALAGCIALVKNRVPWCSTRICTNGDLLTVEMATKLRDAGLDRIYAMRHRPTSKIWQNGLRSKMRQLAHKFPGLFVLMDIDEVERDNGLHDYGGLVTVNNHRVKLYSNGKPFCGVHTHVAQIDVHGDWKLCCVDHTREVSFGNLVNESIMSIWKKPFFVQLRRELMDGKARLKVCKTCPCLIER